MKYKVSIISSEGNGGYFMVKDLPFYDEYSDTSTKDTVDIHHFYQDSICSPEETIEEFTSFLYDALNYGGIDLEDGDTIEFDGGMYKFQDWEIYGDLPETKVIPPFTLVCVDGIHVVNQKHICK